ncbi:MAG: GNAT family N-acetyltransferase [Parachlamydiales bacterium]|jgi:ribosomal protein S18 acetylase RimI-like enzyme
MQHFLVQDKLGAQILIEFAIIDPLSTQFSEKLNSVCECLSRAYVPVEVQFAKQFPDCVSQDKFLHSIAPFFKNGFDEVPWSLVEEKIKEVLMHFFSKDFPNGLAANKEMSSNYIHFFLTAIDTKTSSPLGAIYCLTSITDNEIVRVPIFGVSPDVQSRGIGKLLMSSLLKSIPSTKKIALSTRVTNQRAISAYHAWGFVPSPTTMEYWANLEYYTENAKGLQ